MKHLLTRRGIFIILLIFFGIVFLSRKCTLLHPSEEEIQTEERHDSPSEKRQSSTDRYTMPGPDSIPVMYKEKIQSWYEYLENIEACPPRLKGVYVLAEREQFAIRVWYRGQIFLGGVGWPYVQNEDTGRTLYYDRDQSGYFHWYLQRPASGCSPNGERGKFKTYREDTFTYTRKHIFPFEAFHDERYPNELVITKIRDDKGDILYTEDGKYFSYNDLPHRKIYELCYDDYGNMAFMTKDLIRHSVPFYGYSKEGFPVACPDEILVTVLETKDGIPERISYDTEAFERLSKDYILTGTFTGRKIYFRVDQEEQQAHFYTGAFYPGCHQYTYGL